MKKNIQLYIGISLLIGLLLGLISSEKRYYILYPQKPKHEITYDVYESYLTDKNYKHFVKSENKYNSENAIIFGLAVFGVFLTYSNFRRKNEKQDLTGMQNTEN